MRMVFFIDIQDLYNTRRRYEYGSETDFNGHVNSQRVGGQYAAKPGDRPNQSQSIGSKIGAGVRSPGIGGTTTTTVVEGTISSNARLGGTGDSSEQVTKDTVRSLLSGYLGKETEYSVNEQQEIISKDGKVLGRLPKTGETYGIDEDFFINDKGELIGRDGRVLGRTPKEGHWFGIGFDVIINANGEYVNKDRKMIGRRPTSGDYTINEKGQYVIGNGIILDHAPDSGEYIINEFGEFVSRDGKIIGSSIQGFESGKVTSSDVNVSYNTSQDGHFTKNLHWDNCLYEVAMQLQAV